MIDRHVSLLHAKEKFALDFCTTQLSFMSVPGPTLLCIHPFILPCRPSSCSFFGLAVRSRYHIASSQSCLGGGASRLLQLLSAAIVSSYPLCISQCGQLCTLHSLPDRPLLLRFRIGRLGPDLLHPTFHTRWAQMLAWTVCIGRLVRACSRERAYPPNRDRLSLPLLEGPPLMDPLDVTHGV